MSNFNFVSGSKKKKDQIHISVFGETSNKKLINSSFEFHMCLGRNFGQVTGFLSLNFLLRKMRRSSLRQCVCVFVLTDTKLALYSSSAFHPVKCIFTGHNFLFGFLVGFFFFTSCLLQHGYVLSHLLVTLITIRYFFHPTNCFVFQKEFVFLILLSFS